MEAVDAIDRALDETGRHAFDRLPSLLMGTEAQPRAFCEFTVHEIREAERFLIRAGLLRSRKGPAETAH